MFLKNAWYVAGWDYHVANAPLARTILNEPIVFFRTEDGEVVALEDRCCHRSAPLSAGRIKGSEIECGYHGLRFDRTGACVRVPSQDLVPPGAAVRRYPVVERNRWVWVWMGEAALADAALIPDYFWHDDPAWEPIHDYFHVNCHYQALIDIQLDQTHSPYVHPDTLGNAAKLKVKPTVTREARAVRCERLMPDDDPPPLWAKAANIRGKGDSWNRWVYTPPATIMFDVGAAQAGTGAFEGNRSHGVTVHNTHAITPETESTTHHFWASARNFAVGDAAVTEQLKVIRKIFLEDLAMVEAQARTLALFPNAPTIDVAMDHPTIQARNLLARLIEEERQSNAA
jgi:phenylpropionate dioxygenase-like ring-hydroxylating dioxygenase large terminal subunit